MTFIFAYFYNNVGRGVLKCLIVYCFRQNNAVNSCCISARTIEKNLGLPISPKKPLTPYFRFLLEVRPEIKANNPKSSFQDITRIAAKKWADVSETKKNKYETEFKKEQVVYIKERAAYESQITDDIREQIKSYKNGLTELKEKREIKKKVESLGKPKRPINAYILYLTEERLNNSHKSGTYREWLTTTAEKWKIMSDADKDKYFKSSKAQIQKYKLVFS